MPNPGDPERPQLPPEDAFHALLIDTLEGLDRPARGQFLQRFFKAVTQLDLTETQSLEYWEQILARRAELTARLSQPISLKTAMVDVFTTTHEFRMPILMEFEALKKLQINAATDPLTGLYNRRLFDESFDKEFNRARRYNQSLALVILDLHRFKDVNDRYGHQQGDRLLQTAAETLRKSLRSSDSAFRFGGDEFALLLPQADTEQAAALGRRVRAAYLAAIEPLEMEVATGLDYGLAVYPGDGDQKEVLIRVADDRLYQLKRYNRLEPGSPRPPAEAPAPPAAAPPAPPAAPPEATKAAAGAGEIAPSRPPRIRDGEERRKWERVSLSGTRAYAQLGETPEKIARVLDLGYGGVSLQSEWLEELAENFQAVLHVPILPPVRVSVRRVYEQRAEGKLIRIGCAFIS